MTITTVTENALASGGVEARETARCLLCGSPRLRRRKLFERLLGFTDRTEAQVLECRGCGFRFLFPQITEERLRDFYSMGYFTGQADRSSEDLPPPDTQVYEDFLVERFDKFRATLDLCLAHAPSARRILDVGAATGEFLQLARSRGLEVSGIEISEYASRFAAERHGLELHLGTLEDFRPSGRFDIIHLNHVLEHLNEPRRAVERLRELLDDGGIIYVEVPMQFHLIERAAYQVLGREREFSLFSVHHPVFFTPRTLVRLFQDHGLRCRFLRLFDPRRYPVKTAPAFAKAAVWRLLASMGQGNYIEAIFSRERG